MAAPAKLVSTQTANGGGKCQFGDLNKPDSYFDGGLSNPGTASYMLSAKHEGVVSMWDRVNAFLTAQRPSRFCDDCIAGKCAMLERPQKGGVRPLGVPSSEYDSSQC